MSQRRGRSQSERSQSQTNTQDGTQLSQSEPSTSGYANQRIKFYAQDCVRFLLIADKEKLPIKKPAIVKAIFNDRATEFPAVISEAENILQTVYGIKLEKLPDSKGYILVNNTPVLHTEAVPFWDPLELSKKGVLMIVLSIIFMKGGSIAENDLWLCLKKFGITKTGYHETLGSGKKLIMDEFVKQLYLSYVLTGLSEEKTYEFQWGIRANLKVKKRDVLNFVCKVFGNGMKPESWEEQYKLVEEEGPAPPHDDVTIANDDENMEDSD